MSAMRVFEVPLSLQTSDDRCCIVIRVLNPWGEFQVLATCGLLPVGVITKSKLHVENLQVFSIFMWLCRPLISRISRPNLSYWILLQPSSVMKILKQWIWIPMLLAADRVSMSDQTYLLQTDRLDSFRWTPGTCNSRKNNFIKIRSFEFHNIHQWSSIRRVIRGWAEQICSVPDTEECLYWMVDDLQSIVPQDCRQDSLHRWASIWFRK